MITDLFYDHIEQNHLRGIWATLPGSGKVQKMAGEKLSAFVRGIINGLVIAQWKVMDASISVAQDKIKAAIDKGVKPVAQAKANTIDAVRGKVDDKVAPVREKSLEPLANKLAAKAAPKVKEGFEAAFPFFEEHAKTYLEARKSGTEAAAAAKALDAAVCSRKGLKSCFAIFSKADEALRKDNDAMPEGLADKVSFETLSLADWLGEVENAVLQLLDNAAYTLEQALAEADPTEAGDSALSETMEKAKSDAKQDAASALAGLLGVFLDPVLKGLVMDACDPLVAPLDEHIPEVAADFLSAQGCLEEVLDGVVGNVAEKAAEAAME
jgi:hypothetical protein